jgi:hypothetical protein
MFICDRVLPSMRTALFLVLLALKVAVNGLVPSMYPREAQIIKTLVSNSRVLMPES